MVVGHYLWRRTGIGHYLSRVSPASHELQRIDWQCIRTKIILGCSYRSTRLTSQLSSFSDIDHFHQGTFFTLSHGKYADDRFLSADLDLICWIDVNHLLISPRTRFMALLHGLYALGPIYSRMDLDLSQVVTPVSPLRGCGTLSSI